MRTFTEQERKNLTDKLLELVASEREAGGEGYTEEDDILLAIILCALNKFSHAEIIAVVEWHKEC